MSLLPLIKKPIFRLLCISFLFTTPNAMALTLQNSELYYPVLPKDETDVSRAIYQASPLTNYKSDIGAHKDIALHHAKYSTPSYKLTGIKGKFCYVKQIDIDFNSAIYIPELDREHQHSDNVLLKFNAEQYDIKEHELHHRAIYVKHLQEFLRYFRSIQQSNTTFTQCIDLKNHIELEFTQTMQKIEQANLSFDCYEYGNQLELEFCQRSNNHAQKPKRASFSSVVRDEHANNNVIAYTEKPTEEAECDGELIEPFKGKFYCVPKDSYSD